MKKIVLALSGGLDSSVLLASFLNKTNSCVVQAVNFIYDSKHNKYETHSALTIARHYGIPILPIDVSSIFITMKSSLLSNGGEIPEGHYKAENMKSTVVPGRNLIFASILAGQCESMGYDGIALAVHAGDHHIYPDCRPEFIEALRKTLQVSAKIPIEVFTPFLHFTKKDIVHFGISLNVPLELTRTCYKDQINPCGKCGSCHERLEAFSQAGMTDPVLYDKPITK